MDVLLRDVRYSLRLLVKSPAFALASVLTLALGIGANVAVFSVVYGVLLRPLPYRDASRLVLLNAEMTLAGASRPVSVFVQSGQLDIWQTPFDAITTPAFYSTGAQALSGDSGSEVLDAAVVAGPFFSTLSGRLAAGRALEPADDASPVIVISDRLARRLFPDTRSAVGRPLTLSSRASTVVGVTDASFQFPNARVDVWLPSGFARSMNPRCCGFQVVARLNLGQTLEQARSAVGPIFQQMAGPPRGGANAVRVRVARLPDEIVASIRPALLVLFASVVMVLVIACSNLVNLLLARNAAREREFAIRRALGASPRHLLRQLLAESAVLATGGAAGGAMLAWPGIGGLSRIAGDAVPRIDAIRLDWPVLSFAAFVAAVATVGTGVIPALRAVKVPGTPTPAGSTAAPGARQLQRAMCVVQVALAVTLVVGATLLGRSLVRLLATDLGVSTDHVLTASMNLGFGERPRDVETIERVGRVIEQVKQLPGVRAVGVGAALPPASSRIRITLKRTGDAVDYQASGVPVTPGYFSALHMRLVKGRLFTDADDSAHAPVMIMSEETARRFFGDGDPLGRTMRLPELRDGRNASAEMTLVGVVANVKYAGLGVPPDDAVFRPFAQQAWLAPFLVVRTDGEPSSFAPALRRAIGAADRRIVASAIAPLDQLVADAAAQPRFRSVLLGSLAGLALAIAVVGLYGAISYAVSQRTKEMGIRVALGATSRDVLGMVLGDGMIVAGAGIGLGVAGAALLARLLTGLLYGIGPFDPLSFIAASAGLLALTLVASYIPARRAARIDPIRTLRTE
jgi:predicted permease